MNWILVSLSKNLPWSQMQVWQKLSAALLFIMVLYTIINFGRKARLVHRAKAASLEYVEDVRGAIIHRQIDRSIEISKKFEKEGSHLAGLVLIALEEITRCRTSETPEQASLAIIREEMERHAAEKTFDWKRGLGPLDAIGRTSPFVGAAVGTPFGFFIGTFLAIAALWFTTYFRAQTDKIEVELRRAASEMREFLTRQGKCAVCRKESSELHQNNGVWHCEACCTKCHPKPKPQVNTP